MTAQVQSPLSVNGLRDRHYQSQLSFIKEIEVQESFRAFLVSYPSDGLKVFARINVPSGDIPVKGFPVLVFAHGFSPNPRDPDYFQRPYYEAWINAYTKEGFLVIMPGYRGHGVIDGENAGGGEYFKKYANLYLTSPFYAIDMLNLMAALPSIALLDWSGLGVCPSGQPIADEKNIFLSAHSMGGDIALILLAINKQFNAASIWAGVCADVKDIAKFYTQSALNEAGDHPPVEAVFIEKWGKVVSAAKEEPLLLDDVNQANGFFFLEKVETPFILHQGTNDAAVSPNWSVALHERLNDLGKESTLYLYEGNDHELSLSDQRRVAIERDAEFFRNHIQKEK